MEIITEEGDILRRSNECDKSTSVDFQAAPSSWRPVTPAGFEWLQTIGNKNSEAEASTRRGDIGSRMTNGSRKDTNKAPRSQISAIF